METKTKELRRDLFLSKLRRDEKKEEQQELRNK